MSADPRINGSRHDRASNVSGMRSTARLGTLALVVGLALASCGGVPPKLGGGHSTSTTSSSTTTTTTTKPPAPTTSQVAIFLTRGNALGVAHRTEPLSSLRYATIRALFAGPTSAESAAGLGTVIPPGSVLEGLSFAGNLAYVDVNAQFLAAAGTRTFTLRLAQVVYTITGFNGVGSVQFYLHGSTLPDLNGVATSGPLTRADLSSAIDGYLIESPAVGDTLSGTVTVTGLSELTGTLQVQLAGADGTVLLDTIATTAVGETFTFTYPFSSKAAEPATLRVYAVRSHGASAQLVATIPVTLAG